MQVAILVAVLTTQSCLCYEGLEFGDRTRLTRLIEVFEATNVTRPSKCIAGLVDSMDYIVFYGVIDVKALRIPIKFVGFRCQLINGRSYLFCNISRMCPRIAIQAITTDKPCHCRIDRDGKLRITLNVTALVHYQGMIIYAWAVDPHYRYSKGRMLTTPIIESLDDRCLRPYYNQPKRSSSRGHWILPGIEVYTLLGINVLHTWMKSHISL
ncbi:hypothetical protein Btru_051738 [Bulinus truncatus]|nr:hypothetical protein Btru_051738 [Bulinus truncatus]